MEPGFDVQGNAKATIEDISPLLLEAHLKATGSKLAKQIRNLGVKEVLEQMELLEGPPERQRVKNVALMMFCDYPDKFFPYMQVEITRFPNGSIRDPKNFVEIPPIKGTVPQIIRRTMEKLQDMPLQYTCRRFRAGWRPTVFSAILMMCWRKPSLMRFITGITCAMNRFRWKSSLTA